MKYSLVFLLLLVAPPSFAAKAGCGSEVVFDCDNHTVTFNGTVTALGCGAATRPKAGIIGQPARGAGSVFKSMKGAPIVTMIPTPSPGGRGNVVIHKVPPKGNSCPIQHNRGAGCLRVCPDILTKISHCYGTPYRVIFAKYGSVQPMPTAKTSYYASQSQANFTPRQRAVFSWRDWWNRLWGTSSTSKPIKKSNSPRADR